MHRAFFLIAALSLALLSNPAGAQIDSLPKVRAQLIAEHSQVAAGAIVTVALEESIRPGWHTYWLNPGDAGAPTQIQWTLPSGWNAGPIQWPFPKKLPVGPLMDYGYEGRTWLLVDIAAPKDAKPGDIVSLKAAVSWLVCKEVCIPEDTSLTLPLKVEPGPPPPDPAKAAAFVAARASIPENSPWPMFYRLSGVLQLFARSPSLAQARPLEADFFPLTGHELKMSAPETFAVARDGIVLTLVPSKRFHSGAALAGVLELKSRDGSMQALNVYALPGVVPETGSFDGSGMTIGLALLFALLGGMILNLMPCVLPVLAMKALAVAAHSGAKPRAVRAEALTYGAGVVLSFVALGLLLIVLQAGGEQIGWGFQLQEPIVVAGLALLMFAVGLNLSGVYEINPVALGSRLTSSGGLIGTFFTGVLAVAVAAPCTAPFMAAALGFALAQTAAVALAVFAMLGVGFAAPFVLLGLWPRLRRVLPRPGPWMSALRQVLAFPMYGAAVWLVWILALQTSAAAVALALSSMVIFAFSMWLWTSTRGLRSRGRTLGLFVTLVGIGLSVSCLATLRESDVRSQRSPSEFSTLPPSELYSQSRLASLRSSHRAVFVDATAAWCITCLVNEEAVLSRPVVRDAFSSHQIAYLLADWTRRNPEISSLLAQHGRVGVPLYLYYAPGAQEPLILSQILTEDELLSAIANRQS